MPKKKTAKKTVAADSSPTAEKTSKKTSGASKKDAVSGAPKSEKKEASGAGSQKAPKIEKMLLDQFGPVCKSFILENIRFIDYRDIAKLIGVKPGELKDAVESAGIKLPFVRARNWSDIDVGTFRSLDICARCQVQLNHSTFHVGINNCRKCIEKNIKHWIKEGEKISLMFSRD